MVNISKVDPDTDRACAFARTFFAKLDKPRPIEFREPEPPESMFEKGKASRLRSSNRLADFLKILAVQFNQVGERLRVP